MSVQAAPPELDPDVEIARDEGTEVDVTPDEPYDVLLWNDPVNLMPVVVRVLQKVFGYGRAKAERLMLAAHRDGKTAVWSGDRTRAIGYSLQLGNYGLSSTVARAR